MEQERETEPLKLGTMPVGRLMLSMGLPMILSMMLQAVYNIVDSAFVSNMAQNGELALNALTLAFPMQMLMVAVSIGTGVGTNALVAKSLGQGNREKASQVAGNAMFLGFVIFVVFCLFGLFGVKFYISTQTQNPVIYAMAVDYLRICCVVSFGMVFFGIFEKLLQATGHSMYSTVAQIAGALTNIVLDPILIYGWLGCPELGVRGAACATILGQLVSMALALLFHRKVNTAISNDLSYIKPSKKIIGEIYSIGLPAIIAQALMSVMTYGLNLILGMVGESMVTAYGLYYKIQQFILFAAFGLRDAITPILSFNYGKQDRERIQAGMKYGMGFTLAIMVLGLAVLEIFAAPFAHLFGLSGQTEGLCISAIRIISISFLFAGTNIAFQGIFQALESGLESLVISVCRQILFVLPLAWVLARLVVGAGSPAWLVWLTFPAAELLSTLIACLLLRRTYQNKVAPLAAPILREREA